MKCESSAPPPSDHRWWNELGELDRLRQTTCVTKCTGKCKSVFVVCMIGDTAPVRQRLPLRAVSGSGCHGQKLRLHSKLIVICIHWDKANSVSFCHVCLPVNVKREWKYEPKLDDFLWWKAKINTSLDFSSLFEQWRSSRLWDKSSA